MSRSVDTGVTAKMSGPMRAIVWCGTVNTAVLLTSSLTMAVASQAANLDDAPRRFIGLCLAATAVLGLACLVVKGFNTRKISKSTLSQAPRLFRWLRLPTEVFFALYWILTVVHAVHLRLESGLDSRLSASILFGRLTPHRHPQIEVTALYWHLVDIIWNLFCTPLIYLPGRSLVIRTSRDLHDFGAATAQSGWRCYFCFY